MISDVENENRTERPIKDERIGRFPERLRILIPDRELRTFARKTGYSEGVLRKWLKGESFPDLDRLVRLADVAGVHVQWLATGEGQMRPGEEPEQVAAHDVGSEFTLVPKFRVEASAGAGKSVPREEEEVGKLAFRRDWLRRKGFRSEDLAVIRISGDSMAPTIRDGALALVDRRLPHGIPKSDGIYVIQMDGDLMAKRIQMDLATGGIYIKSDNPAYSEQHLTAEEGERLYVVGRVIWVGGEI